MKLAIPLLPLLLTLSACEDGHTLKKICGDSSEMCEEFTADSWCKKERKATIFANYEHLLNPKDKEKFNQLIAYEKYASCMEHAAKIEHIKLKHKQTARVENYVKAKEKIKAISIKTKNSEHPELLYYHWSRYMDNKALAKFLKMEGSAALETPESQFNLATYYAKRDPKKTLSLLFHALELNKPNSEVNPEIFKSITTIFTDKKEYKQAYIWLNILHIYSPEDKDISKDTLAQYSEAYGLNAKFLNDVALSTIEKIEQGQFQSPKF